MASSSTSGLAAAAVSSGLPGGISVPLETINSTDQGGLITILTAFALSLVLVSFPIRMYVRSKMGGYKIDDYAAVGAMIFAILQAVAVFYALRHGAGKSADLINPAQILPLEKAFYTSDILYVVTISLAKCATVFLFFRLTPSRGHAVAIWATACSSMICAVVSSCLLALRCHPAHPWTDVSTVMCPGLFARWLFFGAFDVITEAALFGISVYLVWAIRMNAKSKLIVVAAFGCRLPCIAIAALRLHYLQINLNSPNIPLAYSATISCTQLEIGYSILSSIIPCLKPFMMPCERDNDITPNTYHYGGSGSGSHRLFSLASNSSRNRDRGEGIGIEKEGDENVRFGAKFTGQLRPELTAYEARVVSRDGEERKSDEKESEESLNSRRMIIKKGVEWSVDFDGWSAITGRGEDGEERKSEESLHSRRMIIKKGVE